MIFPEGQNWTPGRRAGYIRRLRERGELARARRAEQLRNVLPPKTRGAWAARAARPEADVMVLAHVGLARLSTPRMVWEALPFGDRPFLVKTWTYAAANVPLEAEAFGAVARRPLGRGRRLGRGERRALPARARARARGGHDPMRDARTFLVVGGVVALVAVGALAATLAGGGDDTANGSVPVEDVGQLTGSWLVVNDASAPADTLGTVRLVFSADGRLIAQTGCNGVRARCRWRTACSSPAR